MVASQQLIILLRKAICGGEIPAEPWQWEELFKLSVRHKTESLLYYAVRDMADIPDDIRKKLEQAWFRDIIRDTRQEYESERIQSAFRARGIAFAPIKGALLKYDYPLPNLRYMCDIDFYIRTEDRERIGKCLAELDAVSSTYDCGDVAYTLPDSVHAEFHGRLLYRTGKRGMVGYPDWSRVSGEDCLTEEGYALNLIGHMAYDLSRSGIGVRSVLDLWVYRHRHAPQPDWELVMTQLRRDGLEQVAQNLIDLSEYWLGGSARSPVVEELEQYILEGGAGGRPELGALGEASFGGGRIGAVWRQIFRSREEYQNRYPWLERHPILFPVAVGMRAVRSISQNQTIIDRWFKQLRRTSREAIQKQKDRLRRFGFQEIS